MVEPKETTHSATFVSFRLAAEHEKFCFVRVADIQVIYEDIYSDPAIVRACLLQTTAKVFLIFGTAKENVESIIAQLKRAE